MPRDIDGGPSGADWDGPTYYGRPQLKPAPFNNLIVGTYVFLAGLAGGAQLLSGLVDLSRGREGRDVVRRGRLVSLVAPALGTVCLIFDLKTPSRFYNMLRVFKRTSPMSLGTWILMSFSLTSALTSSAHFLARNVPGLGWMRGVARVSQVPAGVSGAGLGTYTAALFSATSTPSWAAAPRALAARFAASSIASAAVVLGLAEGRTRLGRDLDTLAVAALSAELAATLGVEERQRRVAGVNGTESALSPIASLGVTTLGVMAPLGLLLGSLVLTRTRSRTLTTTAALGVLGGSLAMRIAVMQAGDASARRPETSMRFAQGHPPASGGS